MLTVIYALYCEHAILTNMQRREHYTTQLKNGNVGNDIILVTQCRSMTQYRSIKI